MPDCEGRCRFGFRYSSRRARVDGSVVDREGPRGSGVGKSRKWRTRGHRLRSGRLSQSIADVPSRMKALADELEKLYRREQVIERDLARVPQSGLIKPLIEALNDAYKEIAEATTRAASRRALAESLRQELDEQLTACRKLSQAIAGRIAKREA